MLNLDRWLLEEVFMASVIDAFRETFTDKLSVVKIALLALPLYYSYGLYINKSSAFGLIATITAVLLFGALIQVTTRVLNDENSVLPGFNVFRVLLSALKGIIAIAPYVFICGFLANYICSLIYIIPWFDNIIKTLIWLVATSIIVMSFLMFSTKESILDAFKLKILFEKAGDLIIALFFLSIQFAFINVFTNGILGYTIYILFGAGEILNFFIAFAITFNVMALGHFLAQLHYSVLQRDLS